MESVFGRYKNLIVLVGVLFAQFLGLAVQVKRTTDTESSRLIRIWAVSAVTPFEKTLVWFETSTGNLWHNYFYLRGVRAENRELKAQIEQLRLEQIRLNEDAQQARRLQALFGFKEQFISQTLPAQVIGSGGSEQSRVIYIDKGEKNGVKTDMAVITVQGIVGKVLKVFRSSSQVLLIDDQSSGVGGILEKSRLQGIVRGTPAGEVVLEKIMSDETVPPGEEVRTSGGDRIFPKGLPVGTVTRVSNGPDLFLNIHVRPSANLNKLEEVLVVMKVDEKETPPSETGPVRAVDILAQRLPSVPDKPAGEAKPAEAKPKEATPGAAAQAAAKPVPKPAQGSASTNGAGSAATASSVSGPAAVPGMTPAKLPANTPAPAGNAASTTKPPTQPRPAGAPAKTADPAATAAKPKPVAPAAPASPIVPDGPQ
jgi:rod shape-determining protein MreC